VDGVENAEIGKAEKLKLENGVLTAKFAKEREAGRRFLGSDY
jgi:hypothetical protein